MAFKFIPLQEKKSDEDGKKKGFFSRFITGFKEWTSANMEADRQRKLKRKYEQSVAIREGRAWDTKDPNRNVAWDPENSFTPAWVYNMREQHLSNIYKSTKEDTLKKNADGSSMFKAMSQNEINDMYSGSILNRDYKYVKPQRKNPKYMTVIGEGYGAGISVGFIEPETPIGELSFPYRGLRVVGYGGGMLTLGFGITAATASAAVTVPAAALNSTRIKRAADLWMSGRKAAAIKYTGIGVKPGGFMASLRLAGTPEKTLHRFFSNAKKFGPDTARTIEFLRMGGKEGLVWTGLGQLSADKTVSIQQRVMRAPFDFIAGGIFARGQYKYAQILSPGHTFVNKAGKEVLGYKPSQLAEPILTSAAAGFMAPMMTQEGATIGDRFAAMGITVAAGRLAGGFPFKTTSRDVNKAFSVAGVDDPLARSLLTDTVMAKVKKELPKLIDYYAGFEYKNAQGFTAKLKTINPSEEGLAKTGVVYDLYHPNGTIKAKDVVSKNLYEFFEQYKTPRLLNEIEPLERGQIRTTVKDMIDGEEVETIKDVPIATFNNNKDVKTFIENGKWGILSAVNGPNRILAQPKPGFTYTQLLIDELIDRGYKLKDIIVTEGVVGGVHQPRVIVKNLKQNDAFELTRLFGQEGFENQKGYHKLKYQNSINHSNEGVIKGVEVYPRKPGESFVGETFIPADMPKPPLHTIKAVPDGNGGWKIEKTKFDPELDTTPRPMASEFYLPEGGIGDHTLIRLNNGNYVAITNNFDLKNASTSNIPKALMNVLGKDFYTHQGGYHLPNLSKENKDVLGLQLLSRQADEYFNLDKYGVGELKGGGSTLRKILFGKPKLSQLTEDEHKVYQNLLYGVDSYKNSSARYNNRIYQLKLNTDEDRTWGAVGDAFKKIEPVKEGIGNWLMPNYRFWEYSGRKYGSKTLKNFSQNLLDKTHETMMFKSIGTAHMKYLYHEAFEEIAKTNKLKISSEKLDMYNMFALIDPERFGPLSTLTKKEIKALQPLVDNHLKYVKEQYNILKSYGVMEKYLDPKTRTFKWRKIQEVENFIPLTITDDFAKLINSGGPLKAKVMKDLQIQALKKGKKLSIKEIEEKFAQLSSRSEKHGIYGTQFSRTFDLEPVYFLDNKGNIINPTKPKHYKAKKGDKIDGEVVDKRIEPYNYNYSDSMDRYISRISNIAPSTKFFGHQGLYGGVSGTYGSEVSKLMLRMKLDLPENVYPRYKNYLESDLEEIMGLKYTSPMMQTWANISNSFTGLTATAMLSGMFSPWKNLGLGSVQSYATFGEMAVMTGTYNLMDDYALYLSKNILSRDLSALEQSGAKLSGQKIVDTATANFLVEQSKWYKFGQRGLMFGMSTAEIANRNIASYTGMSAAHMSLNILKGNPRAILGFNATGIPQQRVMAERMLRETLKMSDESYYQLLSRKRYFDDTGNEIYLTSKHFDDKTYQLKEFKVGDKVDGKTVAKVTDSPREFTDTQRIMIMARAHAITQGLTDQVYLPKIFNNKFLKPLTLFTRIATSVTDNVYYNVFKPVTEDGNITGLLRYLAGTYYNGQAIEYMYHKGLDTPKEKFLTPMQEIMDDLLTGEVGGVLQIAGETFNSGSISGLANLSQAENVMDFFDKSLELGGASSRNIMYKNFYKNETDRPERGLNLQFEVDERMRAWVESMLKLTALSSQAMKINKNNRFPEHKKYLKYLKWQNDYRNNVLAEPKKQRYDAQSALFTNDKSRYIYDTIEYEFYSDVDASKVGTSILAAVNIEADQMLQEKQDRATDPKIVWDEAFNKVMQYNVKGASGLRPYTLSNQKSKDEKHSDWIDFRARLSSDENQELEQLIVFYKKRLKEVTQSSDFLDKRNRFRYNWLRTLEEQKGIQSSFLK